MIPLSMKGVVTTGDGKFELTEIPVPKPKPEEILVKVVACAQNHTDWKSIILHKQPGNVLGCDFSGIIVALGSAVPEGLRKLGERVGGVVRGNINPNGSFAEYLVTDPALVFVLPDDVPFEVGTQLGVACYATCQALYQTLQLPSPLEPSTSKDPIDILIWSGTSSTGQYATQFAKLSGLRVVSTSSPSNFDFVRSLGADDVFDYADSRTAKKIFAKTGGKLLYAVDCISEGMTPAQVSNSLSKEGGVITTLLPYESRKKGVKTKLVLVYSMWGEDIEIPMHIAGDRQHYENAVKYSRMITEILSRKLLKYGPIKVFPNGLASVEDGFAYMMGGKIHAEKVVYRISDTPSLGHLAYTRPIYK